jgi:predicted nucleic acid-binding protein
MSDAIVDACCFINVYASRDLRGFLTASSWTWHIPQPALAESLYIRVTNDDGEEDRKRIDPQACLDEGLITLVNVEDAEAALYVQLAGELDDGEAMALAIAKLRGWILATDDRKAQRFANHQGVEVITTPELIQDWAKSASMTPTKIKAVLGNIESGARYAPAENAPGYGWWMSFTGETDPTGGAGTIT